MAFTLSSFLTSPRQLHVNRQIWLAIALISLLDIAMIAATGVVVEIEKLSQFALVLLACVAVAVLARQLLKDARLYLFAHAIAQMILGGLALGFFTYLTARLDMPLIDEPLIAIDAFFGFDWRDYVAFMNERPGMAQMLSLSYRSFAVQMVLVICVLFARHHTAHGQRFVMVFIISAFICGFLAALLPAVGGYVYYDIQPDLYANLHPAAARLHEAVLLGMRDGSMGLIRFPMEGIITFPSFHSAVAVLLIYGCLPFPLLRCLLIPINVAMLLSVPVDGGHYLVDVVGGVAIALLAIHIARRRLPSKA